MTLYASLILSAAIALSPSVEADFEERRTNGPSEMFELFDDLRLTDDEFSAMQFLYTYMPLPDLAGYSADFHLANVRATLEARKQMPWGETVPEREFLHFVLPVRVNNEALDLSRPVMYAELAGRVRDLSMKDAILEVNHWCHEYVTYRPSDGRTSPPLSSMSQAIGRCGEESTFTVAALRSVGIPARQVYTPRWAHTDDNHAWVEAWADGEWYFLGACEPAPVLDMGWFNAPAARGLLMTTNVFGRYDGPEEKLAEGPFNTTINVTSKYAPVGTLDVEVFNADGTPAPGAQVSFSIYNYAEFYPAVKRIADNRGHASLNCGLGDLIVWATDGEHFGFAKGNPADGKPLAVVLDKDASYNGAFDFTITPPKGVAKLPAPSAEQIAANDRRLQYEDSVRSAYEATFVGEDEAIRLADSLGLPAEHLCPILADARGNSRMLASLLARLDVVERPAALALLGAVSEKDRRDIPAEVILDNIHHGKHKLDNPVYVGYVLSPRIENEELVPFKSEIASRLTPERLEGFRSKPHTLVDWVARSVEVGDESNPKLLHINPITVLNVMQADARSRNIFFVAMARTAGIPARIDPVTAKVQMMPEGSDTWIDVDFGTETALKPAPAKGELDIMYTPVGRDINPAYYTQFSICSLDGGSPVQLEYGESDGWAEISHRADPLDTGQYLLLTGRRMADGSVLAHGEIFTVLPDSLTHVPLILREDPDGVQVIGSLNSEDLYQPLGEESPRSLLSTTGRGYYILGLLQPGNEPSIHALNDIAAVAAQFAEQGRPMVLLIPDIEAAARFDASAFPGLPAGISYGIDTAGIRGELVESLHLDSGDLPLFVIADTFNRVVFVSQGYTIGIGARLLDTLSKIAE